MNFGFTEILLLLPFIALIIIPMIFFLITQENFLKVIKPDNRRMQPNEVWLQLIPLFNLFWQFIVVNRIAESIRNEIIDRNLNSVSGTANPAFAIDVNEWPTLDLGLAYCILGIAGVAGFFFGFLLFVFGGLAAMICWIIYWTQIAEYKNRFLNNPL